MTPGLAAALAFLALCAGVGAIAASGDWTDRSTWSVLPCLSSYDLTVARKDDRPHKQGGRGGFVISTMRVCEERATIGPVFPRGER